MVPVLLNALKGNSVQVSYDGLPLEEQAWDPLKEHSVEPQGNGFLVEEY